MIQSFALEFDNEQEMLKIADKLWNHHNVTGEIEMLPLSDGRWRINVHSEKQLRDSTLEKLEGKRVQARSILSDMKKETLDESD